MLGIKSMKIWVIDIAIIKTARIIGGNGRKIAAERRKTATRLIWMPGRRPLIVPIAIPKINPSINSMSILPSIN